MSLAAVPPKGETKMRFKQLFIVLGIAAIPAWYTYRTMTDQTITRLDWSREERLKNQAEAAQKTAHEQAEVARNKAEDDREKARIQRLRADVETARARMEKGKSEGKQFLVGKVGSCIAAVQAAEENRFIYLEERLQYTMLTEQLLNSRIAVNGYFSESYFQETFRKVYVRPLPEEEVAAHSANLERAGKKCFDLARTGQFGAEISDEIQAATGEGANFLRWRGSLSEARSEVQLLMRVAKNDFSKTLHDQIERADAEEKVDQFRQRLRTASPETLTVSDQLRESRDLMSLISRSLMRDCSEPIAELGPAKPVSGLGSRKVARECC
jgi:hypothetical protein